MSETPGTPDAWAEARTAVQRQYMDALGGHGHPAHQHRARAAQRKLGDERTADTGTGILDHHDGTSPAGSGSSFKAHLAAQGRALPGHVEAEFENYLKCDRVGQGFLRVRVECLQRA